METILQKPYSYTLSKENENYFLSVVAGSVGLFEVDIQLNETEKSEYLKSGQEYIETLAYEIRRDPSVWQARKIR